MSVESLIRDGRRLSAETLVDRGEIRRPSAGAQTIDPVTLISTPADGTVVYSGPMRVKKPTQVEREQVFGDVETSTTRYLVNLPHDGETPAIGDVVRLTSSHDPRLLALPLRVSAVMSTSTLMFRQVGVEVIGESR